MAWLPFSEFHSELPSGNALVSGATPDPCATPDPLFVPGVQPIEEYSKARFFPRAMLTQMILRSDHSQAPLFYCAYSRLI
jgi:hypothetical protein